MSLAPSEAIVLAGGAGTRLRGVLPDTPKVLAPIGARPFLHRLFETLAGQGIERVVLATGYAADAVETVAQASGVPIDVALSREHEPLGTGGAIAQAFELVRGDRAWVMNGDSYCDAPLSSVAEAAAAAPHDAWLVAVAVEDASRFGTLELDGQRVTGFHEKSGRAAGGWINAGIYLLPRALMPKGAASIERDLFPMWAAEGRLHAVKVQARFIDIGTPESFAAADAFFA
jgi:D-glycero-alpha-D-manno-heptose 1-phosphate guanylyltransferase